MNISEFAQKSERIHHVLYKKQNEVSLEIGNYCRPRKHEYNPNPIVVNCEPGLDILNGIGEILDLQNPEPLAHRPGLS